MKKIRSESPRRSILILQETDEMRHPYESSLGFLMSELVWVTSFADLITTGAKLEPFAVIVDLDCIEQPIDQQIEQIRATFPTSELLALSSSDSSQMALQCIRSGFSDFLLKPASPEELVWSLRKSQQRRDLYQRLTDPQTDMARAISQISSCTTPTLVRLYALEYLQHYLQGEGAVWLKLEPRGPEYSRILSAVPKRADLSQLLFDFPFERLDFTKTEPTVFKAKESGKRKVVLPGKDFPESAIFVWGVKRRITKQALSVAHLLLEHSELSLLNIQKFEEIKHQTFVDDLTGLYNSRYLKYALTNSILRCKEPGQSFSVLFIDVDHFKSINDKHTHLVGSDFLIAIGKTVKNAVRRIDPVFRYGGDEFVVILNDTGIEGAKEIAERIRKNIERRLFVIRDQRIQTTVSIGIAAYPDHAADRDSLLQMADEAMYSAKKKTRNAVHLAGTTAKNHEEEKTI